MFPIQLEFLLQVYLISPLIMYGRLQVTFPTAPRKLLSDLNVPPVMFGVWRQTTSSIKE